MEALSIIPPLRYHFGGTFEDWITTPWFAIKQHADQLHGLVDQHYAMLQEVAMAGAQFPWMDKSEQSKAIRRLRERLGTKERSKSLGEIEALLSGMGIGYEKVNTSA